MKTFVDTNVLVYAHDTGAWDALIIEAAIRVGAAVLVSEDLQDGRQFGTLTVRNPFAGGGRGPGLVQNGGSSE